MSSRSLVSVDNISDNEDDEGGSILEMKTIMVEEEYNDDDEVDIEKCNESLEENLDRSSSRQSLLKLNESENSLLVDSQVSKSNSLRRNSVCSVGSNASLVEVEVEVESSHSGPGDDANQKPTCELGTYWLGLEDLAKNRVAGARIRIQQIKGRHYAVIIYCFIGMFVFVGALTGTYVGVENRDGTGLDASALFFDLGMRVIACIMMSVLCILQSIRIARIGYFNCVDVQRAVFVCTWCAWLTPEVNPAIVAVGFYGAFHFDIASNDQVKIQQYVDYLPLSRYGGTANSIAVAAMFYILIYLPKWLRLEAFRSEHARLLRTSTLYMAGDSMEYEPSKEESRFSRIRSYYGIIPIACLIYMLFRIGISEGFNFDMGFVPAVAWMSVIRFCIKDHPAQCDSGTEKARAVFTAVFCLVEILLYMWMMIEFFRAKRLMKLLYFLECRPYVVAFEILSTLTTFFTVGMTFWAMILLVTPQLSGIQINSIQDPGVFIGGGCICYYIVGFYGTLMYLFGAAKKSKHQSYHPSCRYIANYNELERVEPDSYPREHLNDDEEHGMQEDKQSPDCAHLTYWLTEVEESYFCFDIAILMWNLSYVSYLTGTKIYPQGEDDILLLVEENHFNLMAQHVNDQDACLLVESDDFVVVAFRGNGSRLPSKVYQSTGVLIPEPGSSYSTGRNSSKSCFVDKLLYVGYEKLKDYVIDDLMKFQEIRPKPIFVTGHGTGGSYALFLATDLARRRIGTGIALYRFGSPKCANEDYVSIHNRLVKDSFDITNIRDAVHGMGKMEAIRRTGKLRRAGKLIMMDNSGNIVLNPDWMERLLMIRSRRSKFDAHTPSAYTWSLMQWSQRVYGRPGQLNFRPLWTSCLHEIKRQLLLLEMGRAPSEKSKQGKNLKLQIGVVRAYLESSIVGVGPYRSDTCLEVKVVRIIGLHAKRVVCVVSAGDLGVASTFWEVRKTGEACLQHAGNMDELSLDLSDRKSLSEDEEMEPVNSPIKAGGTKGVDVADLVRMRARFAKFSDEPVEFGTYQRLRPCCSLIIKAIDVDNGNTTFGAKSIEVASLFPLPGPNSKPESYTLTLIGGKRAGDMKIDLEVREIGPVSLSHIVQERQKDTQSDGRQPTAQTLLRQAYEVPKDQPMITYSADMATFYLRRNVDVRNQIVVLRIAVLKAKLRAVDMTRGHPTEALSIVAKLQMDTEKAWTESIKFEDIHKPIWPEYCFSFGRAKPLTGFETLNIELWAHWTDDEELIGNISLKTSVIVSKFKENALIEWIAFDPTKFGEQEESSWCKQLMGHVCLGFEVVVENAVKDQNASTRITSSHAPNLERRGASGEYSQALSSQRHFGDDDSSSAPSSPRGGVIGAKDPRKDQWSGQDSSSNFFSRFGMKNRNASSSKHVDQNARRYLRGTSSMQSLDDTLRQSRDISKLHRYISCDSVDSVPDLNRGGVDRERIPEGWNIGAADDFDERSVYLRLRIIGVMNAFDDLSDLYCLVSLVDPLTTNILQERRTAIVRGESSPIWNEEFLFGFDAADAVVGNEILHMAVYSWNPMGTDFSIGEYRVPMSDIISHGAELDEVQEVQLQGNKVNMDMDLDTQLRFMMELGYPAKDQYASGASSPDAPPSKSNIL